MNEESVGYFLSLLDDAKRLVTKDTLAEKLPLSRYKITKIETVTPVAAKPVEIPSRRKSLDTPLSPMALVRDCYRNCHACSLWEKRPHEDHPGVGSSHPLVLFVGDKRLEDGRYFSKEGMDYFEAWLRALYVEKNKEVHLTSIIKCPGGGFEIGQECVDILKAQVDALRPKAIVFLGEAGCFLLSGNGDVEEAREASYTYQGIPAFVTFSPERIVDEPHLKKAVWDDLRKMGDVIDITSRRPLARKG